jgi:1,4-dihydroxy-2-naphthoate octaprenyltransferase
MKTLKRNLNYIIIAIGVVLVWRGVWYIADEFLLPDRPLGTAILSIIIGLVILLLTDIKNKDVSELL